MVGHRLDPRTSSSLPSRNASWHIRIVTSAHDLAPTTTMASTQPNATAGTKESGLRLPSNGKTIYHRPLNRTKGGEISQASFAYLFGEMVTYAQRRVKGIQELEQRYSSSLFQ